MADEEEAVEILKSLAAAYPGQKIEKETVVIYVEQLRDIPTPLLKRAAERYMQGSQWFPKISNLREIAASMAGTSDFKSLETPRPDALYQEQLKLEAGFYHQGALDPRVWERLADRYERAGRPQAAQAVRDKLKGRVQMAVARLNREVEALEEAFYAEGRLDPGEWGNLGGAI